MDSTLILKLILTPMLIGGASLAGRKWGHAVSGWIVAFPLTSGPVVFFIAIAHGGTFALGTSLGIMSGGFSLAIFSLSYAWVAVKQKWPLAIIVSIGLFLLFTFILKSFFIPLWPLFFLILLAFALTLFLMPKYKVGVTEEVEVPRWDLPARMIITTLFVFLLTELAPLLGARLAGLLSTLPIMTATLTVFAHHQHGRASANEVIRGLVMGLFSFAFFYLALSLLLPVSIALAFLSAIAASLVVQGIALLIIQRNSAPSQTLPPSSPN
jgi:hypothetical protein